MVHSSIIVERLWAADSAQIGHEFFMARMPPLDREKVAEISNSRTNKAKFDNPRVSRKARNSIQQFAQSAFDKTAFWFLSRETERAFISDSGVRRSP